jgi:hypothetical protein
MDIGRDSCVNTPKDRGVPISLMKDDRRTKWIGGDRRLIYVSDPSNTTSHLSDPTSADELRSIIRNYSLGGVDSVVQEIFAECMTMFWRTALVPYDIRPHHQRMVPMMDEGMMPVEVFIDECHKHGMEFIAGFRMNDRHGHHPDHFKQLCEEKPDWVLREYKPSWRGAPKESHEYGCSLNYAVEGVREFLLSIMAEAVSRFDLDGLEFNYTRLVECFPRDQAAESAHIMTDFVRQARVMLRRKSGKNLVLGVRVPQQMAGCLAWGLDVPTWIREGLVDYVAPGDFGFTDFNEKWEDFTSIAREHDCRVYPQTQPKIGIELDPTTLMTEAQYRGALNNIYAAGADGFSVQNHFFHWGRFTVGSERPGGTPNQSLETENAEHPNAYPNPLNFLRQLRNPAALTSGVRHYTFLPLWGSKGEDRGMSGIYEKQEIVLTRGAPETRSTFRFRLCEQLPENEAKCGDGKLIIEAIGLTTGDSVMIDINRSVVDSADVTWDLEADPPTCTMNVLAPPFQFGDNHLGLTLTQSALSEGTITVERLDCFVS